MSNDDIPRMVTCAMVKTSYLLCFDSHCVGWMTIPYISIYIYIYTYIYIYHMNHMVDCMCNNVF